MPENFLNLMKKNVTLVQEAQRIPSKKNPKRFPPRHIKIKISKIKDKEKILKSAREKQQIHSSSQISDFNFFFYPSNLFPWGLISNKMKCIVLSVMISGRRKRSKRQENNLYTLETISSIPNPKLAVVNIFLKSCNCLLNVFPFMISTF